MDIKEPKEVSALHIMFTNLQEVLIEGVNTSSYSSILKRQQRNISLLKIGRKRNVSFHRTWNLMDVKNKLASRLAGDVLN